MVRDEQERARGRARPQARHAVVEARREEREEEDRALHRRPGRVAWRAPAVRSPPLVPLLALSALPSLGGACGGAPPAPRGAGAREHLVFEDPCAPRASAVARAPFACAELVPSWNARAAPGAAWLVELSVADADERWSPWLVVGAFGLEGAALARLRAELPGRTRCALGRVEIDAFVGERPFDRARLRLAAAPGAALDASVALERVAFAFSARGAPLAGAADRGAPLALDVPFRSQRALAPALAPRACSPTALAMALAFHGVARPTEEVAAALFDPLHDVYGNWSRAVQVAGALGVPGRVERLEGWAAVRALLEAGRPIVASVRALPGELPEAPLGYPDGHLLVITGLDGRGGVLVNDPALPDEAGGRARVPCEALGRAWLERRRGTAYVLAPPAAPSVAR